MKNLNGKNSQFQNQSAPTGESQTRKRIKPEKYFFNDNIIVSYSRKNALADEQQFDVDKYDEKIRPDTHIKIKVFVTDTVMNLVKESAKVSGDTVEWILFDICNMFSLYARNNKNSSSLKFPIAMHYKAKNSHINVKDYILISEIGAMDFDDPTPAITIMTECDRQEVNIMKAKKLYRNIKNLKCECNCTNISGIKYSNLMKKAVKANKGIINNLIKKHLPDLYHNLGLNVYNPYPYLRTNTHLILVHSNIEYFLKISQENEMKKLSIQQLHLVNVAIDELIKHSKNDYFEEQGKKDIKDLEEAKMIINEQLKLPFITKEKWKGIPKDYKGKINGLRTCFAGSLGIPPYGTTLMTENIHFIIEK